MNHPMNYFFLWNGFSNEVFRLLSILEINESTVALQLWFVLFCVGLFFFFFKYLTVVGRVRLGLDWNRNCQRLPNNLIFKGKIKLI